MLGDREENGEGAAVMQGIQQSIPMAEVQHGREQNSSPLPECSGCSNEFIEHGNLQYY